MVGLIACDREMAGPLRAALTSERVPELPLPPGFAELSLDRRIDLLRDHLEKNRQQQRNNFV